MNKTILGLLLAVSILGMALIMLKERLDRPQDVPAQHTATQETSSPIPPILSGQDQPPLPTSPSLSALPPLPADDEDRDRNVVPPAPAAPVVPSPLLTPELPEIPTETQEDIPLPAPATTPAPIVQSTPPEPVTTTPAPAPVPPPHILQEVSKEQTKAQAPAAVAVKPKVDADRSGTPKAKSQEPPAKPTLKPALTRFVVFARETGATVRMAGNGPIRYDYMHLDNPPRVVVDLEGDWQLSSPGVPGNPLVSNVRVGKPDGKTRVVIDLKEKPRLLRMVHSQDRKRLDVRVDK